MILSGVSTTGVEIRRTPSGNNVSSADPEQQQFFWPARKLFVQRDDSGVVRVLQGPDRLSAARVGDQDLADVQHAELSECPRERHRQHRRPPRHEPHRLLTSRSKRRLPRSSFSTRTTITISSRSAPAFSRSPPTFAAFLYSDNNLGVRVFGAFANNKSQFNVAWFHQLEKDTNSGLNAFKFRKQNVYIANFFRQDFLTKGYTIQAVGAYQRRPRPYPLRHERLSRAAGAGRQRAASTRCRPVMSALTATGISGC